MALGNDLADKATKVVAAALSSPVEAARNFHNNFHVTAETLRSRFSLTRKEARDIVTYVKAAVSSCQFLMWELTHVVFDLYRSGKWMLHMFLPLENFNISMCPLTHVLASCLLLRSNP